MFGAKLGSLVVFSNFSTGVFKELLRFGERPYCLCRLDDPSAHIREDVNELLTFVNTPMISPIPKKFLLWMLELKD